MSDTLASFPRLFWPDQSDPPTDELGLLKKQAAQDNGAISLDRLLTHRATLVLAPPLCGKSFTTKWLATNRDCVGQFFHRTDLRLPRSDREHLPPWWAGTWAQSGELALWCIDAIDEGEEHRPQTAELLLAHVAEIPLELRHRLRILFTCRENEVPPAFERRAAELFGADFRVFRLAPVDEAEAVNICGNRDVFEAVGTVARKHKIRNAGSPAVLRALLRRLDMEATSSTTYEVWRALLDDLLDQPSADRQSKPTSPLLKRREVAERIALALTFTNVTHLVDEGSPTRHSAAHVGQIFPTGLTLTPVREVLRSAAFIRTADGFQFAQRHFREWFAAFAMDELTATNPEQARALLFGGQTTAPLPLHTLVRLLASCPRAKSEAWIEDALFEADRRLLDAVLEPAKKANRSLWNAYSQLFPEPRSKRFSTLLVERLAAQNLSLPQKELLLDFASRDTSHEFTSVCRAIVADVNEPAPIRREAARAIERTNDALGLKAIELAVPFLPSDDDGDLLKAYFLYALLTTKVWTPAQVLLAAPRMSERVADWRGVLIYEAIGAADTQTLLDILDPSNHSSYEWAVGRREPQLVEKVLQRLADAVDLPPNADDVFVRLASGDTLWTSREPILHVIQSQRSIRRALLAAAWSGRKVRLRHQAIFAADQEDASWTRRLLHEASEVDEAAWLDALNIAERTSDRDLRKFVEESRPDLLARLTEARKESARQEAEFAARRQNSKPKRTLEQAVREIIAKQKDSPIGLLHSLSWVCFQRQPTPPDAEGTFDGLSADCKAEVISALGHALDLAVPAKIPNGRSFPMGIAYEAAAFQAAARYSGATWLTSERVAKWFPSVLRTIHDDAALDAECAAIAPTETTRIFARRIRAELKSVDAIGEIVARRVPQSLWNDEFIQSCEACILDNSLSASGRADLLRVVGARTPVQGVRISKEQLASTNCSNEVRDAAIQVLVAMVPEYGVPLLCSEVKTRGSNVLVSAAGLFDRLSSPYADTSTWSVQDIAQLVRTLFEEFPPASLPNRLSGEAYWVTPADELSDLRHRLISQLFDSRNPEARKSLLELASFAPWIHERLKQVDAESGILSALQAIPGPDRGTTPWLLDLATLVRLLEGAHYRLARTDDELARVIAETIKGFEPTLREDLDLLYDAKSTPRHEGVLQSYLARRLRDYLPGALVDREAWAPADKKSDFLIRVGKQSTGYSTVRIEVKWSKHREVHTSLANQLGRLYMEHANCSRGVYVVAWCGSAPSYNGIRIRSLEKLAAVLEAEARLFNEAKPGLWVVPIVLDCTRDKAVATGRASRFRNRITGTTRRSKRSGNAAE